MSVWEKFDLRNASIMNEIIKYANTNPAANYVPLSLGGVIVPPIIVPPVIPPVVVPPVLDYTITGSLVDQQPNDGTSYVFGKCVNDKNEGVNGKLVRVAWRSADYVTATKSGPHPGYEGWLAGYFNIPLYLNGITPCAGSWDIWVYDPVRELTSVRIPFETHGAGGAVNQVQVQFSWVPAVTLPLNEWLLAEGEKEQVLQLNPSAAIQKRLFADGYIPTSPEFTRVRDSKSYVCQRAERLSDGKVRVYYCVDSNWSNVLYVERP